MLRSPESVRVGFLAGYTLNNIYTIDYGSFQNALYIKSENEDESMFIQQILLSLGIVASSKREDIIEGTIGCIISSEFVGNIVRLLKFVDIPHDGGMKIADFKDKVISIEEVGKTKVYDFIGKKLPHSYICQGAYVHNSNADVIKKATCLLGDRLESYDANIVLQVHDEIVVECADDQVDEVSDVLSSSIIDGWDFYFKDVPMEADVNVKPYWEK